MTRVVIDTNVMISALLFGGTPGRLIPLWKSGTVKPIISREILEEYLRVLSYPRFNLSETEIDFLIYQEILPYFDAVEIPSDRPLIIADDPSDDLFIYCALTAKAGCIISGDHHLLELSSFKEIAIVTPTSFLETSA